MSQSVGGGVAATAPAPSEETVALATKATPKVVRRLLWFLILMYVIAFLDRSNIGFAQNEFKADLAISNTAYALGASIFFIGYAVFEVPSNLIMHKVGAKFWMARIMVTWGIVAAAMCFVWNDVSLYVVRFLLGVAEAGFFPGVILYLTYWIPKASMNSARALFYMGAPIANILGNPLSGLIKDTMNGLAGLRGWQWMFILEGLLAVVVGIWSWFYLNNKPAEAHFLPDDEKHALQAVMDAENALKQVEGPKGWLAGLTNARVWYFAIIYFCVQAAVYGLTFFLPTQVGLLTGQKVGFLVGLVSAIPWICALVAVIFVGRYADRSRRYVPLGITLLAASAIGIFASGLTQNPVLGIVALSVAAVGFIAIQSFFWSLPTEYMSGFAAAAGIGLINSLGNLGGFIAPNARVAAVNGFGGSELAGLVALGLFPLLGAVLLFGTRFFRKTKAERTPSPIGQ